jgi:CelD/BcsL family acetyltransferase involved in cellulose biosynthesis
MHVELFDDPTAFLARDWSGLVWSDPHGTFFHTPAYLKLWWEEFGTGALRLALVEDDGRPIGACAFELVERSLRFLGGFDVTDYMGPVAVPGSEDAVAKELMGALLSDGGWDGADLRGLPVDSPWYEAIEQAAASHGLRAERGPDGVAPMLRLPPSFEDYLAALPPKLRHEIKRKRRRLVDGTGPYRIRSATAESLPEDLDCFTQLHRSSPGPKGKFMHAGMEIFFRRLGEAFLPPHVFHLAFIEVDGKRAAGAIGFAFRNTFSLYNSAFDREFSRLSPGMVLVSDLIGAAIDLDRDAFDMLKGDLGYKYRFGARPRSIGKLVLSR